MDSSKFKAGIPWFPYILCYEYSIQGGHGFKGHQVVHLTERLASNDDLYILERTLSGWKDDRRAVFTSITPIGSAVTPPDEGYFYDLEEERNKHG